MAVNCNKILLTPDEVALQLGIQARTLANWRVTGRYYLPFVKIGGRVMYEQNDIDTFIQQRKRDHT